LIKLRHFLKNISFVRSLYRLYRILFKATYFEDDIRVSKNIEFLNEDNFIKSKKIASTHLLTYEKCPDWRLHGELWAAAHASNLDGDFVQCGVDTGYTARAIIEYVKFYNYKNKKFFLFDTYEGIPPDRVPDDEPAAFWNEYHNIYDFVCEKFGNFKNIKIVKGIVPDSLTDVKISKVSYLSIDMNYSVPERAALEYFWDKMVPGGIITLDDYSFIGREKQKQTADEFASNNNVEVLTLATGQGLILKP
jgi:O-methyltransferase